MSLKLVEHEVVYHKPSLLPPSALGVPCEQVAADLGTLVTRFDLFEDRGKADSTFCRSLETGSL